MICDKWLHIYGNKLGTGVNCEWVDDVVEVVRCKDCKYFGSAGCAVDVVVNPNDYCSYGERAEE